MLPPPLFESFPSPVTRLSFDVALLIHAADAVFAARSTDDALFFAIYLL